MNKQYKKISGLFLRYLVIILVGLGNLSVVYKILTPLTIHASNAITSLFTKTTLIGNTILMDRGIVEIIPSCVAGSAFYLILIIFLSTGNVKPKTRAKALATALTAFFVLNIARILTLILFFPSPYFENIHWVLWHIVSTIFVIAVWFATIKLYKIKSVPFYTDIKYMSGLVKPAKKSKRKKKNN